MDYFIIKKKQQQLKIRNIESYMDLLGLNF